MSITKKRDYSLDFLRGIATLCIIIHHTITYSGVLYAPAWLVTLSLLIDVPVFFFLAGCTIHYSKNLPTFLLRLVRLGYSFAIFCLLYCAFINCYDYFYLDFYNPLNLKGFLTTWIRHTLFRGDNHGVFTAVYASMWFMPIYFKVMLTYGSLMVLISLIKTSRIKYLVTSILLAFSLTGFILLQMGVSIPFMQQQVLFYGSFFLSGYLLFEIRVSSILKAGLLLLVNLGFLLLSLFCFKGDLAHMLNYKFPPHIIFMLFSSFFIILCLYLRQYSYTSKNVLVFIGQNAIYFFYAQGFGTTIMCSIDEHLAIHWIPKLLLSIVINIGCSWLVAIVLKKIIEWSLLPFRALQKRILVASSKL